MMDLIDRVDLVMWTKNGAETLPLVLRRIEKVIPGEFVNKRIIVDDRSTDNTRDIAKSFGWTVILNEGKGISDGANTALKHVTSEYFISFEQDLFLARDWWGKVPKKLSDPKVAIASGIRLPSQPLALRKLHEYVMERYQRMKIPFGKTLDNTIYKTRIIKSLGGFPRLSISPGLDIVLNQRIELNGFKWSVNHMAISIHLRKGLKDELAHYYWYGVFHRQLNATYDLKHLICIAFLSPFRGLYIAVNKRSPQVFYIYPLIRFAILAGTLSGREKPPY